MGYISHNAIVITGWDKVFDGVVSEAERLGLNPVVSAEVVNGYRSVLIPPDGSKEGWEDSSNADDARDALVNYINAQAYGDGSSTIEWVEVRFGSDDARAEIVRSAWTPEGE